MKKIAVLWCFIPWLAVSPLVTGMMLWFSNTEGYRDGYRSTIAKATGAA